MIWVSSMNGLKRAALRAFFALEVFVFSYIYFFGPHGLKALQLLEAENHALQSQIESLRCEVENLDMQIVEWDKNPFYKEKIAREYLQMAKPGEEIFFLASSKE